MNKYLFPIREKDDCWIESVTAKGISDAETKAVQLLGDMYDCVDYGSTYKEAIETLYDNGVIVGDLYDIEEF